MHLTFLGVRGSTAAPGADFVRYGGHTSCIAVHATEDAAPTLVLDAGTGLRSLTGLLGGEPYRGSIMLSHLHWDHVQGLPFFIAGDRDDACVRVIMPAQHGRSGRDLLAQSMSPPAFPIDPDGLRGSWTFEAIEPGLTMVEGYEVVATEVAHKGGRTYGYRVERDGLSLAYLPDHSPKVGVSPRTLEVLEGVDVLIHDAQFLEPERAIANAFGHATVGDAIEIATAAKARTLVLFHHGPARTDDAIDAIAADLSEASGPRAGLRIVVAREGETLDIGSQ